MKFSELSKIYDDRFNDIEITGISCDSRKVQEGSIFVCIEGTVSDGHDFAKSAYDNGASIIITQKDLSLDNQIVVDDTRKVYAQLCAAYFGNPAKSMKLIGVTGTSGKTTVTYMTKSLLEKAGYNVGLIGTIQNIIGDTILPAKNTTPDAYELHSLLALMKKAGCDYVVMEVSSHALDQKRVYGLHYDTAIFTNLSQDHLDYHNTMDEYFKAKSLLFSMCDHAIINIDDEYSERLISSLECPYTTFSAKKNSSTYSAKDIRYKQDGVNFNLVCDTGIGQIRMKTPGVFSVYNGMAAALAAIRAGVPFEKTAALLSDVQGVKGRVEIVPNDRDFTIIIDYAHTPDELINVLSMLGKIKKSRIITVFGCGGDRDRTKRPLMGNAVATFSDYAVVTSDNPRSENPASIIEDILPGMKGADYKVVENRRDAIEYAISIAKTDDIVLLAGKGHETYQILNDGTIHFDEREVVAEILKK